MKYRKLRVAWSVGWGVAAVLLCLLWVRSYRVQDALVGANQLISLSAASNKGVVYFVWSRSTVASDWELMSGGSTMIRRGIHLDLNVTPMVLQFPHGLALFAFAALAVSPWFSSKRFSLRALLIATTLVAVLLGLLVWAVR